jgi:hypothetical protein
MINEIASEVGYGVSGGTSVTKRRSASAQPTSVTAFSREAEARVMRSWITEGSGCNEVAFEGIGVSNKFWMTAETRSGVVTIVEAMAFDSCANRCRIESS